ncbi:hypothetical protein LZG74_11295 [Dyadobacter sp. CY327]|uniref:hypothetical protein n=1 Tax=Dyadobacter sp. CY327 TaxID=2907301 RepID=UPI001F345884|nr:hypothetical protein [Dyadobacter sp. CY327]MCE7070892.1 hypothetical protein [Dyadobacter sp. CY327]
MEIIPKSQSYKAALFQAHKFLTQFGSEQQHFAVSPTPAELEQGEVIRIALANANLILNSALEAAFKTRLGTLKKAKQKQRVINILHFITASAFVSLLSKESPEVIKWMGAVVALIAGVISLTLPEGIGELEKNIDADSKKIALLTGKIASAQFKLSKPNAELSDALFDEISSTINECAELAKELELIRVKSEALNLW